MKKTCSSRLIMQKLKEDDWFEDRVKGDHHQFKHPSKKGVVTIQHPVKDLSGFVLNSIFKQAGWGKDFFIKGKQRSIKKRK